VETRREGFSPAFAGVLTDSQGARTFVKAIGPTPNPDAPEFYRREIRALSRLPPDLPVPKFLWSLEEAGWVVIALAAVDGHTPRLPWTRTELDRVLAAWRDLVLLRDL
jgi:hypothetical protein